MGLPLLVMSAFILLAVALEVHVAHITMAFLRW